MENNLTVFTNEEFGSMRAVMIDGEAWFVGKDVSVALGYMNPQKAIRDHIDDEDRTVNKMFTVNGTAPILINESGLYSLILSSKLPSAKKFKHWITSEVIPSIRKYGLYMTDNLNAAIDDPEVMRQLFNKLNADRQSNRNRLIQLEGELKTVLPKAVYFDKFVDPGYATNFRDTAKEFEIPQKCFIKLLLEHRFIYRTTRSELRPNAKALAKGLFILRDYTNMQNGHRGTYTLVTAQGKKYIYEYFVKKGIL